MSSSNASVPPTDKDVVTTKTSESLVQRPTDQKHDSASTPDHGGDLQASSSHPHVSVSSTRTGSPSGTKDTEVHDGTAQSASTSAGPSRSHPGNDQQGLVHRLVASKPDHGLPSELETHSQEAEVWEPRGRQFGRRDRSSASLATRASPPPSRLQRLVNAFKESPDDSAWDGDFDDSSSSDEEDDADHSGESAQRKGKGRAKGHRGRRARKSFAERANSKVARWASGMNDSDDYWDDDFFQDSDSEPNPLTASDETIEKWYRTHVVKIPFPGEAEEKARQEELRRAMSGAMGGLEVGDIEDAGVEVVEIHL